MDSALRVAIASGIFSLAAVIATFGLPYLTKRRAIAQRETLQSVRQDADRLDGAFNRLEAENTRLWHRVQSLETAIVLERDTRESEREEHDRYRRRCESLEAMMRRHGHWPPSEGEDWK